MPKTVDTKTDKLRRMAERGGTANEREIAARLLRQEVAVQTEETADRWEEQGTLIRHRNGTRAFLRQPALRHFLQNVPEGKSWTYKDIAYAKDYGSGDFYVILSWLLKNGLAFKEGSRYTIISKTQIRHAWNMQVERMKL